MQCHDSQACKQQNVNHLFFKATRSFMIAFVVVYPVSRAMETSFPLIVSVNKTSTCFPLHVSFHTLATSNVLFSTDPPWQSTSVSILHLVIKHVLGAGTYHMTEYCPLIGPQYPVRQDSSQILRPFSPCGGGRLTKLVPVLNSYSVQPHPSV